MNKKQLEQREKELNEQYKKVLDELSDIRNKLKSINFVDETGDCYIYHNSYGGDEKFDTYIKVVDSSVDGNKLLCVEKDCYGKISIEYKTGEAWYKQTKIPLSKFNQQFKKLIKELERM